MLLFLVNKIKLSELGLSTTYSTELMKPFGCYNVVSIPITDKESTICVEAS